MKSTLPEDTLCGVTAAILYYGLLRCCDALEVLVEDVDIEPSGKATVQFNHSRKRINNGFCFWIPEVYQDLFDRYLLELKKEVDDKTRFLKNYNKRAKARIQNCGRNTVNNCVRKCCCILKVPLEDFTSHAFRRSAATNLADAGVTLTNLKRHGQWKSPSAAEGYIANSLPLRREREQKLLPPSHRKVNGSDGHKGDPGNGNFYSQDLGDRNKNQGHPKSLPRNHYEVGDDVEVTKVMKRESPLTPKASFLNPYKRKKVVCESPENFLKALKDSHATFNNCNFHF